MNPNIQKRIRDNFSGIKPVDEVHETEEDEIPASQDFPAIQKYLKFKPARCVISNQRRKRI